MIQTLELSPLFDVGHHKHPHADTISLLYPMGLWGQIDKHSISLREVVCTSIAAIILREVFLFSLTKIIWKI